MASIKNSNRRRIVRSRIAATALCVAALAPAVEAQQVDPASGPQQASPAMSPMTRKLLELLIENRVITVEQAQQLVREAQQEEQRERLGSTRIDSSAGHTVTYVPEPVRRQLKEELRAEMLTKAEAQGWAAPNAAPEWAKRISFSGDVRARAEAVSPDEDNYPLFPNFNAINNSSGFDVNGLENAPFLNATQERERMRIRARVGLDAKLSERISAGVRIATGNDRSPVSTNQTLGGEGELSKYSLWLDRAFVRLAPMSRLWIDVGRAENPYWNSNLIFDDDLNFDGIALRYLPGKERFSVFGTLSAAPIFNTSFNAASTSIEKQPSHDKYMFGAQLGAAWRATDSFTIRGAAGYLDFDKVQGKRSSPCVSPTANESCDTDLTRPLFVQQGNTLFPLRTILPPPGALAGPERQYFGLASQFEIAYARLQFELGAFDDVKISLDGEAARNLAFDEEAIRAVGPINNLSGTVDDEEEVWEGGDEAWLVRLFVGHPQVRKLGAWNLAVSYRHIESDALLDAFTDSDFHLGGTNARGFTVAADLGVGANTAVGLRWYSADEITGPPLSVDVFHLDLTTKF